MFTGTSGQVLDPMIFDEREIVEDTLIVSQPVIRLQGHDLVGEIGGFSTSFINLGSEQINGGIETHLRNIDNWFSFLSNLGLYMGDVQLKMERDNPQWGEKNPDAITMKINYMGLEIGVANYFTDVPQSNRENLQVSDINFGLERLGWALNKTESYFDIIGPLSWSVQERFVEMDAYRSMVLMAAAGVKPSHTNRGSKLRMLSKNSVMKNPEYSPELPRYYFNYWSQFIDFPASFMEIEHIIRSENRRNVNERLLRSLGRKALTDLHVSTDRLCRNLLTEGVSLDRIKEGLEEVYK